MKYSELTNTKQVKEQLRQSMRDQRRAIGFYSQQCAAQNLLRLLKGNKFFIKSRHIAFYFANNGEINPLPLLKAAHITGKKCYLPVVKAQREMKFLPYAPGNQLALNRFNIQEPTTRKRAIAAQQLDLVFVPLLAYDQRGSRLGMGGSFYDRYFEFKKRKPWLKKPVLIGLAHDYQGIRYIPTEPWDIPMQLVATDKKLLHCIRI